MTSPTRTIGDAAIRRFREDGFLVVRGLLDPAAELERLRRAYEEIVDRLGDRFIKESRCLNIPERAKLRFGDRFAIALGASGGALLDHLDPGLVLRSPNFRYRSDLPSAQIPELFELHTAPALLDAISALIGPEIEVSPIHHLQLKLNRRQLDLATEVAQSVGAAVFEEPLRRFHLERAKWHQDVNWILRDARESDIVAAWIPMTSVGPNDGPLLAVPGSHRKGVRQPPYPREIVERAEPLCVECGDVAFLSYQTIHSSEANFGQDARWAFSLRYAPIGQAAGRPYLPGFVARSARAPERELHDPHLWSAMWAAALGNAARAPWELPDPGTTSLERARAMTESWRKRTPDPESWLALDSAHGPIVRLRDSARRLVRRSPLARRINRALRG